MDQLSTILIVDDEMAGRATLEGLLLNEGYNLLYATNGFEALEKTDKYQPDLILLDVMMPGMDGFEVCRQIRNNPETAEIPIILITALDAPSAHLQGIEAGADDCISKPFERAKLRARVRTIVRLNRYRKLHRSEELIREQATLLDIAQDAILVCDAQQHILFWNKSAEHVYGWSANEALGKKSSELLYNQTEAFSEPYDITIKDGNWLGELRQISKSGKEIDVESRWTLVKDKDQNPKSILIVNTDITEKKKLEVTFLRAQRLEMVGALATGIAHDLNNLLTPILISAQLLPKYITEERGQKILSVIEETAIRGSALVKQVLSFGRGLETKRTILKAEKLMLEIINIIRETFPKTIEVNYDVPVQLWTILADATQIHQLLMNLCVNSRDAMNDVGTISISAENFLVDETFTACNADLHPGPYININVEDTGEGIPPESATRIFEQFFTTKEEGKGTGLGLFTVMNIVKNHNGFLRVYSEVDKGTKFSIYLPATDNNAVAQIEEQMRSQDGKGKYLLVIDDEASIREITRSSLQAYNYNVLIASSGNEAISLFSENRSLISVVIIDIVMPVMDGLMTIKSLQEIDANIKIIAVSGLSQKEKINEIKNLGVAKFLSKPFTTNILLKSINEVINSNSENNEA